MPAPATILILNGASSAGKTALLKSLQARLPEPYLDAGIDRFIWMLPARYLDRPLWDEVLGKAVEAGELGHRLFRGMHHAIAALSMAGNCVLADHVLVEPAWVRECAHLFSQLPAYLIGVHCPLDVLIERERSRKDRTLGQAEAQFARVHAHGIYDFEVDTSIHPPETCAGLVMDYLMNRPEPVAFKQLDKR